MRASTVPPASFPSTIESRGTGATSTPCKKPSRRSSITLIVEKIATAILASGLGGYYWNVGASRLGVPVASLWVNLTPFFAILWSMAYGFIPTAYQIVGGLVALSGVVYMQVRKLRTPIIA